IQCAFCHSTVNGSLAPGIGHRLDGWANRDLNVGAIVALAPNVKPIADLLGGDEATVRAVLNSWGPGHFDAELPMDGKAFRPDGKRCSMAPRSVPLPTSLRFLQSPVGICIRPRKCVWMIFKPTAHQIAVIARRPSRDSSVTQKAVSTTTGDLPHLGKS